MGEYAVTLSKPAILTVDDDRMVSAAITRDLRSRYGAEYRVLQATSGAEALAMLKKLALRDQSVALIAADQRMPQMTGIEMLDQARGHAPTAKCLLVTAYADTDVAIKAINDIGLDYYLLKPWDPPEDLLYPVIDDLLGEWRRANPDHTSEVRVVGHRWSERSHDVKRFLASNHVPYRWYDVERDSEAERLRDLAGAGAADLPLVLLPEGHVLRSPAMLDLAGALGLRTSAERTLYDVCIAGGLGLNALLIRSLEQHFQHVFVQPVAGNSGTALGAALYAWHNFYDQRVRVPFGTLCLGPAYSASDIKKVIENCKLRFQFLLTEDELIQRAVACLNDNKIVAWMQGRMELGPRALGNRSILASPLNPYSTENLNVYIKHRESFRKFAASVPEELAGEYFQVGPNARYLATVGEVVARHRDTFAAAILGRNLIRVHTVRKEENPLYHALLMAAGRATGLPVLYNTSFNLFGDPLVCTPRDAVRSFYSSGIDTLFAGSFVLEK